MFQGSLIWLFSLKEPKQHRIVRRIEVLSEFNFEVEYQPGKKHGNADALSRCPNLRDCSYLPAEENDLPCNSCIRQAELMLVELLGVPRTVQTES